MPHWALPFYTFIGGCMSEKLPLSYANKLKDSLYWWLGKKKPFVINDEYKIELLHIDRDHYSAKIRVTNIKNGSSVDQELVTNE
jgi:hypothetical protein